MKNIIVCCLAIFGIGAFSFALAKPPQPNVNATAQSESPNSASLRKKLDWEAAPIKDQISLQQHLIKASKGEISSPLMLIPEPDRSDFLNSIVFSKGGIGQYYYAPLTKWLTPVEAYQVLALFGQQSSITLLPDMVAETSLDREVLSLSATKSNGESNFGLPCATLGGCGQGGDDHMDFRCSGPGECIAATPYICNPQYCQ